MAISDRAPPRPSSPANVSPASAALTATKGTGSGQGIGNQNGMRIGKRGHPVDGRRHRFHQVVDNGNERGADDDLQSRQPVAEDLDSILERARANLEFPERRTGVTGGVIDQTETVTNEIEIGQERTEGTGFFSENVL